MGQDGKAKLIEYAGEVQYTSPCSGRKDKIPVEQGFHQTIF